VCNKLNLAGVKRVGIQFACIENRLGEAVKGELPEKFSRIMPVFCPDFIPLKFTFALPNCPLPYHSNQVVSTFTTY
jgi:hypothetical protein